LKGGRRHAISYFDAVELVIDLVGAVNVNVEL
jgi:hypothetical protein